MSLSAPAQSVTMSHKNPTLKLAVLSVAYLQKTSHLFTLSADMDTHTKTKTLTYTKKVKTENVIIVAVDNLSTGQIFTQKRTTTTITTTTKEN
jgi:hypothetical protein